MTTLNFLCPLAALGLAAILFLTTRQTITADSPLAALSVSVRRGSQMFLRWEYGILLFLFLVVFAILYRWISPWSAIVFAGGGLLSLAAGTAGVFGAIGAECRAVQSAGKGRRNPALRFSFSGGAVLGLTMTGLGLLSATLAYLLYLRGTIEAHDIIGLAVGASAVALVVRLTGGIYAKISDLPTRIEGRFSPAEAVLQRMAAARIGSHVSGVLGVSADLFESYVAATIATMLIASTGSSAVLNISMDSRLAYMSLPLFIGGLGLAFSMLTIVWLRFFQHIRNFTSFRIAGYLNSILLLLGAYLVVNAMELETALFYAIVVGVVSGMVVGLISEWYCCSVPAQRLAEASRMGTATNISAGMTLGFQSVALPVITVCGQILIAYNYAGFYGIGISAVGMLSTVAVVASVGASGPIVRGALSGMERNTSDSPDFERLEESGMIGFATSRGFAICAAAVTALALLFAYAKTAGVMSLDVIDPTVITGLLLGGVLPFYMGDLSISAVGGAAARLTALIRRTEGEVVAQTDDKLALAARQVKMVMRVALRESFVPLFVAVGSPIGVAIVLGRAALGGMLAGSLLSGLLLSLFLTNAGEAWSRAKRLIESGALGAQSAEAHRPAIVGESVGDPLRDIAAPAVMMSVKLMAVVALLIAPLLR